MAYYDPVTKILHGRKEAQIYNPDISVGQVILEVLFRNDNKVIQVCDDDGIELTCSQMSKMMINIAKNMYRIGLRCGDIAGLYASNKTYLSPTIFACLLLRLPMNPIDKSFEVNQIVNIFRETKPKIVFCDHDALEKLMAALMILDREVIVVSLTEKIEGRMHITDFIADCNVNDEFIYKTTPQEKCSFIVCTSGSSGIQKLALVTHLQQLQQNTWTEDYRSDSFDLNMTSTYWLLALNNLIFRTLHAQKRLITSRPFSPDLFIDLMEKYEINSCFLITSHLSSLTESPRFQTADFSRIRYFSTGGIYVCEDLRRTVQNKLTNGTVLVAYGMTEFCGIIAETQLDAPITASVGAPSTNTQVKIQLDDGTTGFLGEIGEILVKSPIKFGGYFRNHHQAKFDQEGWLHTGDIGFIDKNHEINIIGQRIFAIKNVVNEIYPFEIESKIRSMDGISQVVVVGTPDPVEIEIPTALCVRSEDSDIDENRVLEVNDDLIASNWIRGGIFFVNSLPTTPTGKIERKKAKELAIRLVTERNYRS